MIELCAGGAGVTAAPEAAGEGVDIDGIRSGLGAEADAGPTVGLFDEEGDDLDGADHLGDVDEAFGFVGLRAGFGEVGGAEGHDGGVAAVDNVHGVEGADEQAELFDAFTLIESSVEVGVVDAFAEESRGEFHGLGAGVGESEPAGVGGDAHVEGVADGLVEGAVHDVDEFGDDLASGGGARIDVLGCADVVAVQVVIDDDGSDVSRGEPGVPRLELGPSAGVDDDDAVGVGWIDGLVGREHADVGIIDDGLHVGQDRADDAGLDVFAFDAERGAEGEDGAEGIAIGLDVSGDDDALCVAESRGDLIEGRVGDVIGHAAGWAARTAWGVSRS